MRIINIFVWIVLVAILVWFFSMNSSEYVTVYLFTKIYEDVNLVIVIFLTFFIGVIVGAIILSAQVLKAKSEVRTLKRDKTKLLKELDGLRNLSIDEIPEVDTTIRPQDQSPEN